MVVFLFCSSSCFCRPPWKKANWRRDSLRTSCLGKLFVIPEALSHEGFFPVSVHCYAQFGGHNRIRYCCVSPFPTMKGMIATEPRFPGFGGSCSRSIQSPNDTQGHYVSVERLPNTSSHVGSVVTNRNLPEKVELIAQFNTVTSSPWSGAIYPSRGYIAPFAQFQNEPTSIGDW